MSVVCPGQSSPVHFSPVQVIPDSTAQKVETIFIELNKTFSYLLNVFSTTSQSVFFAYAYINFPVLTLKLDMSSTLSPFDDSSLAPN